MCESENGVRVPSSHLRICVNLGAGYEVRVTGSLFLVLFCESANLPIYLLC